MLDALITARGGPKSHPSRFGAAAPAGSLCTVWGGPVTCGGPAMRVNIKYVWGVRALQHSMRTKCLGHVRASMHKVICRVYITASPLASQSHRPCRVRVCSRNLVWILLKFLFDSAPEYESSAVLSPAAQRKSARRRSGLGCRVSAARLCGAKATPRDRRDPRRVINIITPDRNVV